MKLFVITLLLALNSIVYSQIIYITIDVDQSGINECLTGIDNTFEKNMLTLFPNPNKGYFTIKTDINLTGLQVDVIDISGKSVLQKKLGDGITMQQINLSHLNGTYLLYVYNDKARYFAKVIIK